MMLLSHQPQGTLNTLPVKSVTAAALTSSTHCSQRMTPMRALSCGCRQHVDE